MKREKRFTILLLVLCMVIPCLSVAEDASLFSATITLHAGMGPLSFIVYDTGKTDANSDVDSIYRIQIVGSDQETVNPLLFNYINGNEMVPISTVYA
jgi:hypothetical protein